MRAWLVGLLLLPLLAPPAAADHVYSHRFVFEGRLVGANDLPLPGRTVTFFAEGDDFLEPCKEGHQPTTDLNGDFRFCFHKHALKASTTVGVRVDNITVTKPMETAMRRSIVLIRDPNATGVAPPGWNDTFRIAGKVWLPGPTTLEGVDVFGTALAGVPVNVTLDTREGGQTRLQVTTDGYGDFDAVVRLLPGVAAGNVSVTAESMGKALSFPLSAEFHRTTVGIIVPPAPVDVRAPVDESEPGTSAPRATPLLLGSVGVALVAALVSGRRKLR